MEKLVWEEFQVENMIYLEVQKLESKQNTHNGFIYKQIHLIVGFNSAR